MTFRALAYLQGGLVEAAGATEVMRGEIQEALRSAGSIGEVNRDFIEGVRNAEAMNLQMTEAAATANEVNQLNRDVVQSGLADYHELREAGKGVMADLYLMDGVSGEVRAELQRIDPSKASREIQGMLADLRSADTAAEKIDGVLEHLKGSGDVISKEIAGVVEKVQQGELSAAKFGQEIRRMKEAVDRFNPNSALGAMLEFLEQTVAQEAVRGRGLNGPGLEDVLGGGGRL